MQWSPCNKCASTDRSLRFVSPLVGCLGSRGGGGLPIMAYTGRLRPKGAPFSVFSYMKGKGFYSLKYTYERVGKSVIWVC